MARFFVAYPHNKLSHIFGLIESFGGYGFNKSHATAYAMLSYRCGYYKSKNVVLFYQSFVKLSGQNRMILLNILPQPGPMVLWCFHPISITLVLSLRPIMVACFSGWAVFATWAHLPLKLWPVATMMESIAISMM